MGFHESAGQLFGQHRMTARMGEEVCMGCWSENGGRVFTNIGVIKSFDQILEKGRREEDEGEGQSP